MDLSPESLRQTVFPVTKSGYDQAAVDSFIGQVADALAAAAPAGSGSAGAVADRMSELLRGAEETAAALKEEAEAGAEAVREKATSEAAALRTAAESEATGLRAATEAETADLRAQAARQASEVAAAADAAAEAVLDRARESLRAATAELQGGDGSNRESITPASEEARKNIAETMAAAGFSGDEIEQSLRSG